MKSRLRKVPSFGGSACGLRSLRTCLLCLALALVATSLSAAGQVVSVPTSLGRALRPGDVIELDVWNEPELRVEVPVEAEGDVTLPLVGPVRAGGLTPAELKEAVEGKLRDGYLVDPQVTIRVVERRSTMVYVLGAVRKPGVFPLEEGATLLEILALCGGATEDASDAIIIVRRGAQATARETSAPSEGGAPTQEQAAPQSAQRLTVSRSLLLTGELEGNVALRDGDVVLFPPSRESREQVYVLGDVERRGSHALDEGVTLAQLLASLGLNPGDEKATVSLMRFAGGQVQTQTFTVRGVLQGTEGQDLSPRNGDIYVVEQAREAYYVIGQVQAPGAFRFQEGLTVQEAIIMAGWITARGNLKNVSVMRKAGTEWKTEEAELSDPVRPGDVVKVEERWF